MRSWKDKWADEFYKSGSQSLNHRPGPDAGEVDVLAGVRHGAALEVGTWVFLSSYLIWGTDCNGNAVGLTLQPCLCLCLLSLWIKPLGVRGGVSEHHLCFETEYQYVCLSLWPSMLYPFASGSTVLGLQVHTTPDGLIFFETVSLFQSQTQ